MREAPGICKPDAQRCGAASEQRGTTQRSSRHRGHRAEQRILRKTRRIWGIVLQSGQRPAGSGHKRFKVREAKQTRAGADARDFQLWNENCGAKNVPRAAVFRCSCSASRPHTGSPELRLRQPSPVPSLPASCGHHHQMHGPCHGTQKHLLQNEADTTEARASTVGGNRQVSAVGDTHGMQPG